ncbi:hypothetical protein [Saliphagus sp. LR7]|uniref:DUF7524 family protein n=1 Tax=Saliphagus sp. LR7 TaxID=2282654 RepID=UPI000DF77F6A|nr:hypothetical protein [Saliphagus sp. LR7]
MSTVPPEEVTVTVSRKGPQPLDARPSKLEVLAGDRFGIAIENEGSSAHVHCRITGELGDYLSIDQSNHYVEAHSDAYISLRAPDVDRELEGTLAISTGYGATTVYVGLAVTAAPEEIEVDETLGIPASGSSGSGGGGRFVQPTTGGSAGRTRNRAATGEIDRTTLAVTLVGVVAIGVAVVSASVVGGSWGFLAVLAVAAAVAVAGWLAYTA